MTQHNPKEPAEIMRVVTRAMTIVGGVNGLLALRLSRIAAAGLLVLTALAGPVSSRDAQRSLSDSLAAVYEAPGGAPDVDWATAGLTEYLAYAATQSPAVRAAFYEWTSVLERSGYAGAPPYPSFTYGYFIESVETRVGPQTQVFRLRQDFPWFGTLGARKDITTQASRAAYEKFESEKLKLFYQVKSAYYEYYYLGRAISITRDNLELLTFWESVARAKYRVALTRHPDIIKAQVELGKLEDRLRTVEQMATPVVEQLRAVMNLPDSVELPVPTEVDIDEVPIDGDTVIAEVLANNPDLKSLQHLIDKEQAAMRLAGKVSWPSFSIGVDYIDVGEAVDPTMPESGKDAFLATVGMSIPIWFGANKSRKDEAEARYRRAQSNLADAQNRLRAFSERIIFEYDDALRKTKLYRDGLVPKAEQSLDVNYTAYQAGETDFLNLLDAQRQLLDFQLQFERSRSNLGITRSKIEMVTGRTFSESTDE